MLRTETLPLRQTCFSRIYHFFFDKSERHVEDLYWICHISADLNKTVQGWHCGEIKSFTSMTVSRLKLNLWPQGQSAQEKKSLTSLILIFYTLNKKHILLNLNSIQISFYWKYGGNPDSVCRCLYFASSVRENTFKLYLVTEYLPLIIFYNVFRLSNQNIIIWILSRGFALHLCINTQIGYIFCWLLSYLLLFRCKKALCKCNSGKSRSDTSLMLCATMELGPILGLRATTYSIVPEYSYSKYSENVFSIFQHCL